MKSTIEDVIISQEDLAELNKMLNSATSTHQKTQYMNKIAGGHCSICGNVPSKKVSYDISDSEIEAKLVERYCDKCIVRLTATNGDQTIAVKDTKRID
jgi:hypothetical protein